MFQADPGSASILISVSALVQRAGSENRTAAISATPMNLDNTSCQRLIHLYSRPIRHIFSALVPHRQNRVTFHALVAAAQDRGRIHTFSGCSRMSSTSNSHPEAYQTLVQSEEWRQSSSTPLNLRPMGLVILDSLWNLMTPRPWYWAIEIETQAIDEMTPLQRR
jgi:hypothetical protein